MISTYILVLFFVLFSSEYLVSTILSIMNLSHSLINKNSVPSFIKDTISLSRYSKTVDYTQRKGRYSLLVSTVTTIFTALVILFKVPALYLAVLERLNLPIYVEGITYILSLSLVSILFSLPFSLYSQFIIEEEFGFNKMTFKLYWIDMIKSGILSILLFVPLLLGLFLFMQKSGQLWWIYAYAFFTIFQLLTTLLYPMLIAPIFNKFTELEEGSLKKRLISLAEKTSFKSSGIYVMDGSRRSGHSNAYFTGFGKGKRIVLFDTLIKQLTNDELEAVLAHEIGHYKKKHILKRMVFSLLSALIIFYLLSILLSYNPLYLAFGFTKASLPALLVILSFIAGPLSFFVKPIFSGFSRKDEYEADRFAAETLNDGKALIQALILLGTENLSNLTPHKSYSRFYYSHPVLAERIDALENFKKS